MSKRTKAAWQQFETKVQAVTTNKQLIELIMIGARELVAAHKKPLNPKGGNDDVQTPQSLADAIVKHFAPYGRCLEPCAGENAFVRAMKDFVPQNGSPSPGVWNVTRFEIKEGSDWLQWEMPADFPRFDWCITNPPWSKFRPFLAKCMETCENVVFLDKLNAWGTSARLDMIEAAGWEIVEKARVKQPRKPWPQMGMQLAAVHVRRCQTVRQHPGHLGEAKITRIDWTP